MFVGVPEYSGVQNHNYYRGKPKLAPSKSTELSYTLL